MLSNLEHMIKMANDIANFCGPANPKDFETENAFYDEIATVWLDCWNTAYKKE